LINQPPRSLKSICVSVAYVAWLLGHDPTRRVIVASYSGDFAAELHRQFRMVVGSEWYAALFPNLRWAKETGLEFITTQGGADTRPQLQERSLGVIDWYGGALVSRLNDKQTARSLRSCSACPRTTLLATSCDRAVGIIWTCLRSRWRTRSSSLVRPLLIATDYRSVDALSPVPSRR
jgi:hypothetical protein